MDGVSGGDGDEISDLTYGRECEALTITEVDSWRCISKGADSSFRNEDV